MTNPATLVLADGTIFSGVAIGKEGQTIGEVVFNTAMVAYQEVLTDPASSGQLITFTYPHIGNTGVNAADSESDRVQAAGLIIRDLPFLTSNFRSEERLEDYLKRYGITGISGIDTRRLTRHIRMNGAQMGCIVTGENPNITAAIELAKNATKQDCTTSGKAETATNYEWQEGIWHLGKPFQTVGEQPLHVVVLDLGVTKDSLRHFAENGCRVTVVPSTTSAPEIVALKPNGLFLSNGAGDPAAHTAVVAEIKALTDSQIPLFAVGLGSQLLGLALGGKVTKLAYGRHGMNHPVQDIATGKVIMTTQNQRYLLLEESLPESVIATHYSLVDQTLQGFRLKNCDIYAFQGYPEGDATFLFDQLIDAMWTK